MLGPSSFLLPPMYINLFYFSWATCYQISKCLRRKKKKRPSSPHCPRKETLLFYRFARVGWIPPRTPILSCFAASKKKLTFIFSYICKVGKNSPTCRRENFSLGGAESVTLGNKADNSQLSSHPKGKKVDLKATDVLGWKYCNRIIGNINRGWKRLFSLYSSSI